MPSMFKRNCQKKLIISLKQQCCKNCTTPPPLLQMSKIDVCWRLLSPENERYTIIDVYIFRIYVFYKSDIAAFMSIKANQNN